MLSFTVSLDVVLVLIFFSESNQMLNCVFYLFKLHLDADEFAPTSKINTESKTSK